jgi:hypothetical protein
MPPKKSTRTELRITHSHVSHDTGQAAASTVESVTPTVLPEAEIENDHARYDDLCGQKNTDSPLYHYCSYLSSLIPDMDHLDLATQN